MSWRWMQLVHETRDSFVVHVDGGMHDKLEVVVHCMHCSKRMDRKHARVAIADDRERVATLVAKFSKRRSRSKSDTFRKMLADDLFRMRKTTVLAQTTILQCIRTVRNY